MALERNVDGAETCEEKHSDSAERGGRAVRLAASEERLTFLVEEEEARSVGRGHVLGHVADFEIVHESSEEEQEPYGQKGALSTKPRKSPIDTEVHGWLAKYPPSNRKIHQSQY